jgi:hypothetical protein
VIAPDKNNSNKWDYDGESFTGIFDGNGFVICNLNIDTNSIRKDFLGLFGHTSPGSKIKNLGIADVNIISDNDSGFLGGLCGYNGGSIIDCYSTGSVTGGSHSQCLGGLVGENYASSISNCYSTGSVTCGDMSYYIGGLVGEISSGAINNCYSTGSVTGGNYSHYLGGLVGENYRCILSNSYAIGEVTGGDNSSSLGGLCGWNSGSITNCYATGSVTSGDDSVYLGGLCGGNNEDSSITNCYSTGSVTGGSPSNRLGGLVGWNRYGTISNCYATGAVAGGDNSDNLGGLVGRNYYGTIINSYSTGSVACGVNSNSIGGLVGENYDYSGTFINCFWDTQTSGMTDGVGNEEPDPEGVKGKTTEEMKKKNTFTDWDFAETWGIEDNQTYPFLRLMYPVGDIDLDGDVDFVDFAYFAAHWLEE